MSICSGVGWGRGLGGYVPYVTTTSDAIGRTQITSWTFSNFLVHSQRRSQDLGKNLLHVFGKTLAENRMKMKEILEPSA